MLSGLPNTDWMSIAFFYDPVLSLLSQAYTASPKHKGHATDIFDNFLRTHLSHLTVPNVHAQSSKHSAFSTTM